MNQDQVEGKWDEFTAKVKQQWGDLTDDEVKQSESNVEELKAKIQQKYGDTRESVSEKFNKIMDDMKND